VKHACYRGSRAASAVAATTLVANRIARTWMRMVDAFMAPSEVVRRKLAAVGLPAQRIHIVPNFLADDPGVGAGGGRYAVFAGRLAAEKGIDTLLRAWAELSEPMTLKIAGDGPLAETVRRAAGADARIEWLGWRSSEDVLQLIGGATCLLSPSMFHEAFGRVVIEAYAKGTPVIGSRRGAIAELVEDGVTGYLFEPGNSSDLLTKLRLLTADAQRYAEMRRHARRRFEERYMSERCYDGLMELYSCALRHHGAQ
jgi:glycosyltransferase involved in cell wall biosynthesis